MRISDWSSDVCSSDLPDQGVRSRARQRCDQRLRQEIVALFLQRQQSGQVFGQLRILLTQRGQAALARRRVELEQRVEQRGQPLPAFGVHEASARPVLIARSEEHTSELQSLMRISYAVFCLKKKNKQKNE